MRKAFVFLWAFAAVLAVVACAGGGEQSSASSEEVAKIDTVRLPDTVFASVEKVEWNVEMVDSTVSGRLENLVDPYDSVSGSFTFRGGQRRDANYGGKVKGTPTKIVQDWMFQTYFDNVKTKLGTWGGGTGWTGQPVYVKWTPEQLAQIKKSSKGLTADFGEQEIMFGSLCSKVYFLNFETGKPSREPLDVINPVKGSVSLDPSLNGSLYVGHGIEAHDKPACLGVDLVSHEIAYEHGPDPKAKRNWHTYDSSPVVAGQFLFWPCENGSIYKFSREGNGKLTLHSALRYTVGGLAPGIENSLCVYKNYGFVGDNHGNVLCINLDTMKPVWYYNNHDDIDASIVFELEDGKPVIYCGCEVDRQGVNGISHLVKLNALDGSEIWHRELECKKLNIGEKHFDGGFYGTPLLGQGDCKDLLFAAVCQQGGGDRSEFTAFNRKTGETIYSTPLKYFSWTSPVAFYNENNELFIFTGDSTGNAYLIRGKTGEIIFTEHMVNNFESSGVAVDNHLVIGSRGQEFYRFSIL